MDSVIKNLNVESIKFKFWIRFCSALFAWKTQVKHVDEQMQSRARCSVHEKVSAHLSYSLKLVGAIT